MEVGPLPDLFAGAGGYVHKRSFQGDGVGALVQEPGANSVYCLILHPFLTLLIQPCYTSSIPGANPPTTCTDHAFQITCHPFYFFSMFHIKLPLTHLPSPTHRGFRVISILISNFLLGNLLLSSRGINFWRETGSKLRFFSHTFLS